MARAGSGWQEQERSRSLTPPEYGGFGMTTFCGGRQPEGRRYVQLGKGKSRSLLFAALPRAEARGYR